MSDCDISVVAVSWNSLEFLPRALDSKTNQPLTLLLPGTRYAAVGQWEQLKLEGVAALLSQQAWQLRVQSRLAIDTREAYLKFLTKEKVDARFTTHGNEVDAAYGADDALIERFMTR